MKTASKLAVRRRALENILEIGILENKSQIKKQVKLKKIVS